MPSTIAKTYSESMQELADEYLRETGATEATTQDFAMWAIRTRRWEPPPDMIVKKCKEDFASALREQVFSDENGPVRAKHVARRVVAGKQTYLWADIRNTTRKHIVAAFKMRREQVVGECRQMDRDSTYWNKMNPDEEKVQLDFDFNDDVDEGRFSAEYPPKNPR
jgi:hypothetical protein